MGLGKKTIKPGGLNKGPRFKCLEIFKDLQKREKRRMVKWLIRSDNENKAYKNITLNNIN